MSTARRRGPSPAGTAGRRPGKGRRSLTPRAGPPITAPPQRTAARPGPRPHSPPPPPDPLLPAARRSPLGPAFLQAALSRRDPHPPCQARHYRSARPGSAVREGGQTAACGRSSKALPFRLSPAEPLKQEPRNSPTQAIGEAERNRGAGLWEAAGGGARRRAAAI